MDTFRCIRICDCLCVCKPVCGSCSQFEAVSIESASGPTAKCFNFNWKIKIKITAGPQAQFQFLLFLAVFLIFEITVSLSAVQCRFCTGCALHHHRNPQHPNNDLCHHHLHCLSTLCGSNFKSGFLESHLDISFYLFSTLPKECAAVPHTEHISIIPWVESIFETLSGITVWNWIWSILCGSLKTFHS